MVTTDSEMLTTNGHSLDQTTDSVGSPSDRTLVGSISIEHVPLNDASMLIDDPAAHTDNTAEPNDSTTGPIDDTTEPNDDTTEPNDDATEPNDHTAESNDVICELDTSECNSNISLITKVPNTSNHLSGTQIGENLVHKHIRASVTSPTVTVSTQKVTTCRFTCISNSYTTKSKAKKFCSCINQCRVHCFAGGKGS